MRRKILLALTLGVAGLTSHAAEFVDGGANYNPYVAGQARMSYADPSANAEDSGDQFVEQDPTRSYVPRIRHRARRRHARVGRSATSNVARSCDRFIKADGQSLGDFGEFVKSAILRSKYRANFLAGSGIQRYCPAYRSSWSEEQKMKAWVAFWEVLGSVESRCGEDPQTYAPRKQEIGIWQLERFHRLNRYRAKICQNIRSVADEAACAVSIMGDTQFKRRRPVEFSGSYWGPIRWLSESKLIPRMRRFAFCN